MASFQPAYDLVAQAEGGYQKYPDDTGNYNSLGQLVGTNWGINAQVYEARLGRPPSEADMRNMPSSVARGIYEASYWARIKGAQINSQAVANVFFDGHVNHGMWGIKMMQEVLGVAQDGIVGPITLAAINAANPADLVRRYVDRRRAAYQYLADSRSSQRKFLAGWLARLEKFSPYSGGGELAGGGALALFIGLLALGQFSG